MSDESEKELPSQVVLLTALDHAQEGIIILDAELKVVFMNPAARSLWKVSDKQVDRRPSYTELVSDARRTGKYDIPGSELETFIENRIARVRNGISTPQDLRTRGGRYIRSQCTVLPDGGRILTYWDVSDLVTNAQELERLATTDSMTGLYNRRHFLSLAETEWARFRRYHRPLSLLMVDIDHFKRVNDSYGHATGDIALTSVAAICMEGHRSTDIVGRIGGEEFAVLLPETESPRAAMVAERIRNKVASRLLPARVRLSVTVSIGIARATASMSGIGALMHASDQALYEAKAKGRNKVAHYVARSADARVAAE